MGNPESPHEIPPVGVVASLIGNTEKKNVLQLLVRPGETITAPALNERFAEAQHPRGTIKYGSLNNLAMTISNSHRLAAAFIAPATVRYSEWEAYKPDDSEINDAIAGHMLSLSADYALSLEELFGKSSTTEGNYRSPQVRIKLFESLSKLTVGQCITIGDLASSHEFKPSAVHKHVQRLHQYGFVSYQAEEINQQQASFMITGNADPALSTQTWRGARMRRSLHYRNVPVLRAELGHIIMDIERDGRQVFSYRDLTDRLTNREAININMDTLQGIVSLMLREGVIARQHKTPNANDAFSQVRTDSMQKEIIDRVTKIFHGLSSKDASVVQQGIALGETIMSDPALVTKLLERSYTHTPSTKRMPYEVHAAGIIELLGGREQVSTRTIQQQYHEGTLTLDSIGGILRKMREENRVVSTKHGNQQYWTIKSL
jgi:hypothetical protein